MSLTDTHTINKQKKIDPFLRWTGSKRWFVKNKIEKFLPEKFNNYHEPFLGGGAVFFYMKSLNKSGQRKYFLSDLNSELINVYSQIQNNREELTYHLKRLTNSEEEFYRIRKSKPRKDVTKAARFIYLNKTAFNGMYRVNSKGIFNVPYGKRQNVDIVCNNLLIDIEESLKNVSFSSCSFENTTNNINKNDLVFLDPPYTVLHENNGFVEYNQRIFSWEDQIKLRDYIEYIIKVDAYFILTNASHESINELYSGIGYHHKISRYSKMGSNIKSRGMYNELVITNIR